MAAWKINTHHGLIPYCGNPGRRYVFDTWSTFKCSNFYGESVILWRWVTRDKFVEEMMSTGLRWWQVVSHLPSDATLDILEFCTANVNINVGIKPYEDEKLIYAYLIENGAEIHE